MEKMNTKALLTQEFKRLYTKNFRLITTTILSY